MKKIRFISLLLVIVMLVAAAVSCAESKTETDETTADTSAEVKETEIEEETRAPHKVPEELDFDGEVFTTLYPIWQGYTYYFFVESEEECIDSMSEAIYKRQCKVEEELNVKLEQVDTGDGSVAKVYTMLQLSVTASDDAYQQVLFHCIYDVSNSVTTGMLYNLDDLNYTDFDADWWNKEMMDELRLGTKTYYGVSDYMLPCPYVIFYNKEMVENKQLGNPYQLVYDHEWTIDKMFEMGRAVIEDVDSDGSYTEEDIWGISLDERSKMIPFITSSNQFITEKDENGKIVLAINTEKTDNIINKFKSYLQDDGALYWPEKGQNRTFDLSSGKILFDLRDITSGELYRNCEIDVGMLPYPLYDENQEEYVSLDWGGLMGVPSTISNPDMVGAVLELLAYYSEETVIANYYGVVLDGKIARDEDSEAMIDLMFDTIAYEIGGNYFGFTEGFTQLFYMASNIVLYKYANDFASWYAKYEKAANNAITKFYSSLAKYE